MMKPQKIYPVAGALALLTLATFSSPTPLSLGSVLAAQAPQPAAGPSAPAQGRGAGAAAPVDVPPEPVTRLPNGPAVLTEDFESGDINQKVWATHQSGAETIAVTQERAAHGRSALHVRFPAGTAGASSWAFVGTSLPESLRDHFYGRAYVYISGPAPAHNVYMLAGTPGFPIADFLEIGYNGGNFMISYQQNAPGPDHPRSETTKRQGLPPAARWFCLEWEFTDKPVDRTVLWIDGTLAANQSFSFDPVNPRAPVHPVTSGLVGGFHEFNVGFRAWSRAGSTTEDIDVYYDDVAIGDKPIGPLPR